MTDSISYRNIWKLCLPLMGSMLATTVIHVTDTAFLGRMGEVELGAAAIGGVYYLILMMAGLGLSIGAQILMARADGEGDRVSIGPLAAQTLVLLGGLSLAVLLLHALVGRGLIGGLMDSVAVHTAADEYLRWRILGLVPLYLSFGLRAFYAGVGHTSVIGQAGAAMAISNIGLDYLLVFGECGFPQLGIAGAAIASSLSEAINLIYMWIYGLLRTDRERYGLLHPLRQGMARVGELLTISAPIMIQMTVSLMSWFFFFMIIEGMGERPLALSNVARAVYSVLMVPLIGISQGTQTLVSNLIGQGRANELWVLIKRLIILSVSISLGLALLNLIDPYILLSVFTSDQGLMDDTLPIIHVITLTLLFFAIGGVLLSTVSGTGRTMATLIIEVVTLSFYLIYTYALVHWYHCSLAMAWTSEAVYFVLLAALSLLYIRFGRWRPEKV